MLGRMRGRLVLATAAAAAMLGAAFAPAPRSTPPTVMRSPAKGNRTEPSIFNLPTGSAGYGRRGAGITMAAQQRASAKRRNVARNRRAHR